jgi:hypothetical protein
MAAEGLTGLTPGTTLVLLVLGRLERINDVQGDAQAQAAVVQDVSRTALLEG